MWGTATSAATRAVEARTGRRRTVSSFGGVGALPYVDHHRCPAGARGSATPSIRALDRLHTATRVIIRWTAQWRLGAEKLLVRRSMSQSVVELDGPLAVPPPRPATGRRSLPHWLLPVVVVALLGEMAFAM